MTLTFIYVANVGIYNKIKVLRDMAVILRCHPLFVWPVPYYLPGKASFKLCYVWFGTVWFY